MNSQHHAGHGGATTITLAPAVVTAVRRILPAASRNPAGFPWFGAVLLDGGRAVTFDRSRFAVVEVDARLPRVLLPAKPLALLVGAAEEGLELTVYPSGTSVVAAAASSPVLVALPADPYPDVDAGLSLLRTEATIDVDVATLAAALQPFARALVPRRGTPRPVILRPGPDQLRLRGQPVEPAVVPARCSGQEPIGVNARYLLDLLAGLPGGQIRLHHGRGLQPLWARDDSWVHALVPYKLDTAEKATS